MQCGMQSGKIISSQRGRAGIFRALVLTIRGFDRYTGCRGSTREYARQLKRDLEQGHDFNRFEISFGGYSFFPRQLDAGSKVVLTGEMLYRIPQDALTKILRLIPDDGLNKSQQLLIDGVRVCRTQSGIFIEPSFSLPTAEDIASLNSWHSSEVRSIASMVTSCPSVIGDDTTLAGMISRLKIETLKRACLLSQKALESQSKGSDIGFSLVTGGSLSYGPRLRSDIDFLVVHDGDNAFFSRFCDEIKHTLLDLGIESHNLVSVGATGVDSISLTDLRRGRIDFRGMGILTKSRPFLRAVEGIGSTVLFNEFTSSKLFNKAGNGFLERAWFWNKLRERSKAIIKPDCIQDIKGLSAQAIKAFKLFIQFAKTVYDLQEIELPKLLSEMRQRGFVSEGEYNSICSCAELFWKLDNVIFVAGQINSPTKDEDIAAEMGCESAEELMKEIHLKCGDFNEFIVRFIKTFGGSETKIRAEAKAVEAMWRVQEAFQKIGEYFENGNAIVYLRRSKV
ncbi:MAG: hypothetical protein WC527_05205 [Candidatus Margulisiibacteriota bacterium]